MQTRKEFAEILAEKMQTQSDSRNSNASYHQWEKPHFHAFQYWVPETGWQTPSANHSRFERTDYKKFQKPPAPRPDHKLDTKQSLALVWFKNKGLNLPGNFRIEELKKGFRTLAHQLHPDKPQGSTQQFLLLKQNYDLLMKVFA